jgi:hypothetical protein
MPKNRVEQFVLRVQKKLNQYLLWQVLIWAAATGACCLVAIGAAYI